MTSIPFPSDPAKNPSTSEPVPSPSPAPAAPEASLPFDALLAEALESAPAEDEVDGDESAPEGAAEGSEGARAALRALGLRNPGTTPTKSTPLADLLLYALAPYGGEHPEEGMVLAVAAELESLAMFIDGPLSISLEMMARRLRTSIELATRLRASSAAA